MLQPSEVRAHKAVEAGLLALLMVFLPIFHTIDLYWSWYDFVLWQQHDKIVKEQTHAVEQGDISPSTDDAEKCEKENVKQKSKSSES